MDTHEIILGCNQFSGVLALGYQSGTLDLVGFPKDSGIRFMMFRFIFACERMVLVYCQGFWIGVTFAGRWV